ncbi:MAG: ATP-binding protein [Halobacteriaceae archaeon]
MSHSTPTTWDDGAVGIVGIAAALALGALAQLYLLVRVPTPDAGLVAVVLLLAAGAVASSGFWLRSATDCGSRWRVAGWTGAGVIALSAAYALVHALHTPGGVTSAAPALLVMQAAGAVAGLGGGVTEWRSVTEVRRTTELEADDTAETDLAFVNGVLRHHLLNGLQIVDGYADDIAASADDAIAGRAERIRYRSRRLVTLVENLRALIEAEHGAADCSPVDAVAVLRETVGDGREYDATVSVGECPPSAHVEADALFGTLIDALLRAAAAGENGAERMTVRVERTDTRVLLRVADDRGHVSPVTAAVLGSAAGFDDVDERTQTDEGVALHLVETLLDRYDADAWLTERESGVTVTAAFDRVAA